MALKVVTWNVENFFLPGGDAGPKTPAEYEKKRLALAGVIVQLDADVVALQELGGEQELTDLQLALGTSYPHRATGRPDSRGIRVGFLSKVPFVAENIEALPELPFKAFDGQDDEISTLGRGALRASINVAGRPIHLITAHLKSKLLTYPGTGGGSSFVPKNENERARVGGAALTRRAAEAAALRVRANALLVGNATDGVIVLGDLNDAPEAATTQLLAGPEGSQPVTRAFDLPDKGDDARLFNLANFIPEARRSSRIHAGVGELLDQIFVSEELVPVGPDGRRLHPTVDTHAELQGGLPSVTEASPNERRGKPFSDHAPVTALFPWL